MIQQVLFTNLQIDKILQMFSIFFILSAQMDKANKVFSNNNSENVT